MFLATFIFEIGALITGLVFINKIMPVIYRWLILLLFITVLNEMFVHYNIYALNGINKMIMFNSYFMLQFILITIIYSTVTYANKYLITFSAIAFMLSVGLLSRDGLTRLNIDVLTCLCIALIIQALFYLFYIYSTGNILNLERDSIFLFSIGLITVQFLLLFYINAKRLDSFKADDNWLMIFKVFNTTGNLIYYSLIIYSFICLSLSRRQAGT